MVKKRMSKKSKVIATIAITGGLGIGGGTAYAFTQLGSALEPAGVATEPGGPAPARVVPNWPTNAAGLTYGSLMDANSPEDAPDLIRVETQDGKTGYVKRSELDAATGANVASPAEAIAWQESVDARVASGQKTLLPVYQQDGTTLIGQFEVTPSQPAAAE